MLGVIGEPALVEGSGRSPSTRAGGHTRRRRESDDRPGQERAAEAKLGTLPFWRQYLRGFSQCAFQANEITGLLFVIGVLTFSWRMAVFYVLSVFIATVVARLLKADRTLLDLGLFGFNSGLMGLAMGNFYEPDLALWGG